MSQIVQLPDGQTAHFRDPGQVPERLRRPVSRALMSSMRGLDSVEVDPATGDVRELTEREIGERMIASGGMDALDDANDLLVLALVTGWSYDAPVTLEALLDLPGDAYDALREESAPHLWAMLPKNFRVDKDPESPTKPSSD